MEKKIFMFRKNGYLVYEVVTNEGDNWYWATVNGTEVSLEEVVDILNQQEYKSIIASLPVIGSEW
jgi:hypothetical protein